MSPIVERIIKAAEEMEKLKAQSDVRKSGAYFAILSMPACTECQHKARYVESPTETIFLCEHQMRALKAHCVVQRTSLPPLNGFRIVLE